MTPGSARDYLAALYAGCDGVLEMRAFDGPEKQCFAPLADLDPLRAFVRRHPAEGIYHGVATRRDDTSGALANCRHLPCMFVDLDFHSDQHPDAPTEAEARATLAGCPVPPSILVLSGGGAYPLWLLREPLDLQDPAECAQADHLIKRLTAYLGADASAAEPARVLRLPGTRNFKYTPPPLVTIEHFDPDHRINVSELTDWLPPLPREAARPADPAPGEPIKAGGRNTHLASLAGSMRRRGMTPEAIGAALREENARRCAPPLDDAEVAKIARSVGRYPPSEPDGGEEDDRAQRLARELDRQWAQREARRQLDRDDRGPIVLPTPLTLRTHLSIPRPPTAFRIAGWQPQHSRVMLAAQFKSGKTTVVGNAIRSLVDGDPFLGRDHVQPVTGTVAILDTEMGEGQGLDWLRTQGIRADDRVVPWFLRGRVSSLDLTNPEVRGHWAAQLRAVAAGYLVIDCQRPILDVLGLDEHHDAGRLLVAVDALLLEAGIPEALIVHHMGHTGERARGDSRIRDWPDVEWRLIRQDDDPASLRYLSAYGRDVDQPEAALTYDPVTRRLLLTGGTRQDVKVAAALAAIVDLLQTSPGALSARAIQAALADTDHPRDLIRTAIRTGISTGRLVTEDGPRNAILHRVRECAAVRGQCAPRTANECAGAYIDTRTRTVVPHGVNSTARAAHSTPSITDPVDEDEELEL